MKDICEFYPTEEDDCVCDCGSDVSGHFVCTKQYSLDCQWAIERRKEDAIANSRTPNLA